MIFKNKQSGFTLIELAVVLVIMGVLTGSIISTLGARIKNVARVNTLQELESIKQALIGYALVNKRLPCPDNPADTNADNLSDGDGISELSCTPFAGTDTGSIPWVTLGLGAGDEWGNRYGYWVYGQVYANINITLDATTAGAGRIQTRNFGVITDLAGTAANPVVVAVIYSRGENGNGAVGVDNAFKAAIPANGFDDEEENADGDKIFISRPPTYEDDTTLVKTFDDIVIWISAYELKAKMVEAGVLP